jgi:hypothetical protein
VAPLLVDATEIDGSTTLPPRSYDYRLTNVCDFKCRMCGDQLSSAWEIEKRREGDWDPSRDPWMAPNNKTKIEEFQRGVITRELERAVEEGRLEEIYWVGGEPLIWEDHWRLMGRLVELGHAKQLVARYNTNLSRIQHRGVNLFDDLLPHVKNYSVCASIDAETAHRDGLIHNLISSATTEEIARQILPILELNPQALSAQKTMLRLASSQPSGNQDWADEIFESIWLNDTHSKNLSEFKARR